MATKIQLRRDTAADWTAANPTLAAGEFGYESDTAKFKIGDGSTAWSSLGYIAAGTITALNNQAANRLTTIGATTTELDGEANLTFDGSTLAVTGGITATTSMATDAVSIDDNKITSTRSNDDLNLEANGTGRVLLKANGGDFANYSTSNRFDNANVLYHEDLTDTIGDGVRDYGNAIVSNYKLTAGQSSSNSNDRWRNTVNLNLDLNGSSSTATSPQYRSRGLMAQDVWPILDNNSATAATLGNASGGNYGVSIYPSSTGDITVTGTTGMGSYLDIYTSTAANVSITDHVAYESIGIDHYGGGAGNLTITDHYHFRAGANSDGATGTLSLTNNYGFYFENDSTATNTYAFYSASDTAKSRVGSLERYREEINTLTSSSTITVDCGLAPVHTVTLGVNTQFVISNLGTGQSVTIIITNGASYTASFGTDASTAVKFPGGAPTLTASGIDAVTIFNDGTNYLGNIAQAYA